MFSFEGKYKSIDKKLLFVLLLLSSCSIQKRHFTSGYDIQWKRHYASNSNELYENDLSSAVPCDTVKNRDGSVILARVERIDSKRIYVTPCENSGFTKDEIDRTLISSIRYSNGALFENKTTEQLQKEREENLEKYRDNPEERKSELIKIRQEELAAKKQENQPKNDSLVKSNFENEHAETPTEKGLKKHKDSSGPVREPVMRVFFTLAFIATALTLALAPFTEFVFFPFLALFLLVILSPFFTLYSVLKIRRSQNKFKGRPILREFFLLVLSFIAALIAIEFQF